MYITKKLFSTLIISSLLFATACTDLWDDHYDEAAMTSKLELYQGTVIDYMHSNSELSALSGLFDKSGVTDQVYDNHDYTIIVYPNGIFEKSDYVNDLQYAKYCICDNAISPARITDGLGLHTWLNKVVWFNKKNNDYLLDKCNIQKIVKAKNGYIYYISDAVIPIRQSIYDVLNGLGDDYSVFKGLVKQYDEIYFDPSINTPIGTNPAGNTIYKDSVWSVRNTLMDRYTSDGAAMWNMRSDDYASTMLIPSNNQIQAAIDTAMSKIPVWLGRAATDDDRIKFEKWIVKACFFNKRLTTDQITGNADIDCVGGCVKIINGDKVKYTSVDAAMWRPWVQKVRTDDAITASNGYAYFIDYLKIPNNVVIYRLKSRFYELWENMTPEQREKHFVWEHWKEPLLYQCNTAFTVSDALPTIYYYCLTAIPDDAARKDSLECSVTYDGVLYNKDTQKLTECYLPAGEYYLRMGFQNRLLYSLSIQFNGKYLVKDMVMWAQGANYHFDRGSASVLDSYGTFNIGYPEGYDPSDWAEYSNKASAYDTDGYQVAIVNIPKDGNFKIRVSSSDMSYLYNYSLERSEKNDYQLKMYHWCLRPTKNNY